MTITKWNNLLKLTFKFKIKFFFKNFYLKLTFYNNNNNKIIIIVLLLPLLYMIYLFLLTNG